MPMTLQQAAQSALDCQDACNLSGVLHTFHQVVKDVLWPEANKQDQGTAYVNQHPIVSLFLDKLASLNRTQCLCSPCLDQSREMFAKVEGIIASEIVRVGMGG